MLDQYRSHKLEATKERDQKLKTRILVIPGDLSSQLQPLDVSINESFKAFMKDEWNQWMIAKNKDRTPTGRLKRPRIVQGRK